MESSEVRGSGGVPPPPHTPLCHHHQRFSKLGVRRMHQEVKGRESEWGWVIVSTTRTGNNRFMFIRFWFKEIE